MNCESLPFQFIRLVDVLILGPVMIQAGRSIGGNKGRFLAFAGIATIIFNGLTFIDIGGE